MHMIKKEKILKKEQLAIPPNPPSPSHMVTDCSTSSLDNVAQHKYKVIGKRLH